MTGRIANNARELVTDAGRPVISFDHVKTRNRAQREDELAEAIAQRDGITEGIVCLISAVESCMSFQVRAGALKPGNAFSLGHGGGSEARTRRSGLDDWGSSRAPRPRP